MDQQVGNAHHRIVVVLADDDVHQGAVLLGHHAVQRQGPGHPLVFLHAAVIMGVGVGDVVVLIEGVLLDVNAGGVDVGPDDVEAVFQGLFAHVEQHDRFTHVQIIQFVAGLDFAARRDGFLQIGIARFLRQADGLGGTFPLGLARVQISLVIFRRFFHGQQGLFIVFFPCVWTFHFYLLCFIFLLILPQHNRKYKFLFMGETALWKTSSGPMGHLPLRGEG